jgi:hypothetical protein
MLTSFASLATPAPLALGIISYTQAPSEFVAGTVTRESRAVIPNSTVTITYKATGASHTAAAAQAVGQNSLRAEVQGVIERKTIQFVSTEGGCLHV